MKIVCGVLMISIFFCCSPGRNKKDRDILSEKEMTEVMWDLMRADQYVNDFVMKDSAKNKKEESVKLYEEIFRLHHTTAGQFEKSQAYYEANPQLFRPIIDSLTKKQSASTPPVRKIPPDTTFKHRIIKPIKEQ